MLAIGPLWGAGGDACLGACSTVVSYGQHIAESLMVTAVESMSAPKSSSVESAMLAHPVGELHMFW